MSAAILPLYPPDAPMSVVQDTPSIYNTKKSDDKLSIYQIVKMSHAKGIPTGTKEVLAQVCNFTEYGDHKCFDGNVETLANKLGMSRPKVSLHLKRLVECGLLLVSDTGKRTKRQYFPCPELVAAYQVGNTLEVAEVIRSTYHSVTKVRTTVLPSTYHSVTNNSKEERDNSKEELCALEELGLATAALKSKDIEIAELKKLLADRDAEIQTLKAKSAKKKLAAPKPADPDSSAPLVQCYVDWYKSRSNGIAPMFEGGRDGKAGKEIFDYLRNQSKNKDSSGAVAGMMYIFTHWSMLDQNIQKQTHLWQIRANVSAILVQIANGRKRAKDLEAQRQQRELEPEVKYNPNPLAIPQSPHAYKHEVKPEYAAEQARKEQERRDQLTAERLAKFQQEQQTA